MYILPPQNKLILGVSSVWISSLIYDSYLNNLYIFMFLCILNIYYVFVSILVIGYIIAKLKMNN